MDLNQKDEAFAAILKADQVDVTAALAYVDSLTDERKKNELVAKLAGRLSEVPDFNGLYRVLKERQTVFSGSNFTMVSIRDLLTRACRDRMDKAFLKAADFGGRVKPQESFRRFDLLRSLHKGKQVIDKASGYPWSPSGLVMVNSTPTSSPLVNVLESQTRSLNPEVPPCRVQGIPPGSLLHGMV